MSGGSAVIYFGPWGGPGGNRWSYIATNGITEITIYSGDIINSISFKDANGFISGKFGGENHNDLGKGHQIPINWPSEYLMSISGSYKAFGENVVIGSLSFITNVTTHGPYGTTNSGQAFSIPIADSSVVGFHGRAGDYIEALGIYVKPINPSGSVSAGPWGGTGGGSFSFKVDPSYIKQITVSHEQIVLSISFKDGNGHVYGPYGTPNVLAQKAVIEIDGNSQRLTSLSGTYGNYNRLIVITSISFVINSTIYGPYGRQTGTAFSIPIEAGEVVGFHGRVGWHLDSIGLYVKPINPSGSVSVGPWGGTGGGSFSFKVDPSYIKQITVSHEQMILSISFKDGNGHEYGPYGGNDPNVMGQKTVIEIDGNSQRLTSLSGTYGNYRGLIVITSISFVINSTINGPYGSQTGTAFSIPIEAGEVVGFHGSGGWYLDSIGLYVKPKASSNAIVA